LLMVVSYFFGSVSFPQAGSGQVPPWYLYYMVFYSFFPVAVVEEAFARGYVLDRLMPENPLSLRKAVPAILLSSLLFTLYHIPGYLRVYMFSPAYATALLGLDVFPMSVFLSMAYVKAGTRNVAGPVLLHFLADGFPVIIKLVSG
jgi:membrane protease YdiL (CAAX protease family)